jgi:hypothetical protein
MPIFRADYLIKPDLVIYGEELVPPIYTKNDFQISFKNSDKNEAGQYTRLLASVIGEAENIDTSEVTLWTTMSDLSRNQYYVRSINAMNFAMIDMNKLKNIKQMKSVSSYDVDKAGADVFNLFYK